MVVKCCFGNKSENEEDERESKTGMIERSQKEDLEHREKLDRIKQ